MEVKEPGGGPVYEPALTSVPSRKIEAPDSPSAESQQTQESQAVAIDLSVEPNPSSKVRKQVNRVIDIVNIAVEATSELERLVKGVEGIVEQYKPELPEQRKDLLTDEATSLIDEITNTAKNTVAGGIRPLLGDPIRLELEKELGQALEVILPDRAKDAFGLAGFPLSRKDFILNTQARVASAREHLDELRRSVHDSTESVRRVVGSFEVALQNREASKASIRDVDQALSIAIQTRLTISKNPDGALGSLGNIQPSALKLLE